LSVSPSLSRFSPQALSCKYKGRLALGISGPKHTALTEYINATTLPAVALLPKAQGLEPTLFDDKVSFIALDFFLMDHALPQKGSQRRGARVGGGSSNSDDAGSKGRAAVEEGGDNAGDAAEPAEGASSGAAGKQQKAGKPKAEKPKASKPQAEAPQAETPSKPRGDKAKGGSKKKRTDLSKLTRPALNAVQSSDGPNAGLPTKALPISFWHALVSNFVLRPHWALPCSLSPFSADEAEAAAWHLAGVQRALPGLH
jgi:hypothetical protein